MTLEQMAVLLAGARLPAIDAVQWAAFGEAGLAVRFVGCLETMGCGDGAAWQARQEAAVMVRAVSPLVGRTLARLGLDYSVAQVVAVGNREGMGFFRVLHVVDSDGAGHAAAARYIADLGFAAVMPVAAVEMEDAVDALPVLTVPPYFSFHVYGKSAALCFSEARTRAGQVHTVQIEGAGALTGGARVAFDWQNKIIVQLTPSELFQVLALFEGKLTQLQLEGHGVKHDKFIHFACQDSHYFVRLAQKGRPALAIPVNAGDGVRVISLLYRQIRANEPHLDFALIQALVGRLAVMQGKGTV